MGPARLAEPSVNQALVFFPLSEDHRELPMRPEVKAGRVGDIAGVGTIGIWDTFSSNLLVPSVSTLT